MKHTNFPKASRPIAPGYGIKTDHKGLQSWYWAKKRLVKSRQYFLTTVNNLRPHTMPVWGVWMNDSFWFSTGRTSRKARNLSRNKYCTISMEKSEEALIIEGKAGQVKSDRSNKNILRKFNHVYKKKYGLAGPSNEPIYRVKPIRVFGLVEKSFPKTATRWTFKIR